VAERLGKKSVSRSEFLRETGISAYPIRKHFDSWNDFVRAAELKPIVKSRIADDELFQAMKDAFLAAGKVCTQSKFERLCRHRISVYRTRGWGNWTGTLWRFREWVTINVPDFPYLTELPMAAPQAAGAQVVGDKDEVGPSHPKAVPAAWTTKGGRHYGCFLNFRGLLHAPTNENGVVFLFGMVAVELGYVVESITSGLPDCEAKRRLGKGSDTWERVRIEFEYESRTFLPHGHKLAECDVIVCWEDNWPDCPIEVLELKTAIQALAC
jgi:hypothetical protein